MGGKKRLTNEVIDYRIKERPIERISNYTDKSKNTDKLKWKCLIDGHVWETSVANILGGKGCPVCAGKLPLNNEIIDKELPSKIKRISDYPGKNNIKMKWECLVDGHIWEAPANYIRSGKGCPVCAGNLPLNNDIIDQRLKEKKLPIKRVGNYTGYHSKLEWECIKDGYRWEQKPAFIFRQNKPTGCPKCAGNVILNNNIVDELIKDTSLERKSDYTNNQNKIEFKCLLCGHELKSSFSNLKHTLKRNNNKCPKCNRDFNRKKMKEDINNHLNKFGVVMIGEYKTTNDKVSWRDSFGNCWEDTPSNVLNKYNLERNKGKLYDYSLPKFTSQSEKEVKEILESRFSNIEHQKLLRSINRKFFVDFYLIHKNKPIAIEYNGIQHYQPVGYFGGYGSFEKQKERDEKLRKYCKENDIILIEIPYDMEKNKIIEFVEQFI